MKKIFNFRLVAISLILLSVCCFSAVAQAQLAEVYGQIDAAFKERDFARLNTILSSNFGSEYYTLYESYSLKKTRQLIIEGDLDNARSASLIVIDNNLENFDAVELYSYIDKAILNKEIARQKEEERKALEAARLAAQREKTKAQVKKTYNATETSSGTQAYTSELQDNYTPVDWNIGIGIVDVAIQTIPGTDNLKNDGTKYEGATCAKYGLSFDADVVYTAEQFFIGGDLSGSYHFLSFGGKSKDMLASVKLIPKIAFPRLWKHFFFRIGFAGYFDISSGDSEVDPFGNFLSANAGIGLENISFGAAKFKFTAEYCLGSLAQSDMKAALDFGTSILIPISASEHTKVGVRFGVSDLLMIRDAGPENRCDVVFAIGVGNVDR